MKILENNKIKKLIEFHIGWNNLDTKTRLLINSLMNGKQITNKNDLLELEMLGLIKR